MYHLARPRGDGEGADWGRGGGGGSEQVKPMLVAIGGRRLITRALHGQKAMSSEGSLLGFIGGE
ncbi:MAG: hypothetical protein GY832_13225 [Chloroflexi bacterium]|nr:hypothetical protein [Chloroflexota bacterium]